MAHLRVISRDFIGHSCTSAVVVGLRYVWYFGGQSTSLAGHRRVGGSAAAAAAAAIVILTMGIACWILPHCVFTGYTFMYRTCTALQGCG